MALTSVLQLNINMDSSTDAKQTVKKQTEKMPSKSHDIGIPLTSDCLLTLGGKKKSILDDDQETVLNVTVKRPSFDITGAQTYVRACGMQHVVPSSKLFKQLSIEGNTVLNLPYYGLSDKGTMALSIAMLVNTSVTSLYLSGNNIGEKGISYIHKMMAENTSITDLDLSENNLKDFGAKTIAAMLETNRFIQKLDISGNEFADSDAQVLARSIEVHPVLEWVNLSHNLFSDKSSLTFEHLIENCKLLFLDLSWNQFRTQGAKHIASGLKENAYLKILNVSWNGFDDEGGAAFGDALANNAFLKELDISSCRIASEGFGKLMSGLKSNEKLEVLRVGGNYIPDAAVDTALELLTTFDSTSTTIGLIDFSGIYLPRDFDKKMLEVRKTLPKIKIRPGWDNDFSKTQNKPKFVDSGAEALLAIKHYLDDKRISVFKLFRKFDRDNSDTVDYNEFIEGIKTARIPLQMSKVTKLLHYLDTDGDGQIELKELASKLKEISGDLVRRKTVS